MPSDLELYKIAAENDPDKAISLASRYFDVPEEWVRALEGRESGGDQAAISPKGARGRMQLMPGTARLMGVNPDDEIENIWGGVKYLQENLHKYNDNLPLALAAYNAGPGVVERFGGVPPYRETVNHVRRVMKDLFGGPGEAEAATMTVVKKKKTPPVQDMSPEELVRIATQGKGRLATPKQEFSPDELAKFAGGTIRQAPGETFEVPATISTPPEIYQEVQYPAPTDNLALIPTEAQTQELMRQRGLPTPGEPPKSPPSPVFAEEQISERPRERISVQRPVTGTPGEILLKNLPPLSKPFWEAMAGGTKLAEDILALPYQAITGDKRQISRPLSYLPRTMKEWASPKWAEPETKAEYYATLPGRVIGEVLAYVLPGKAFGLGGGTASFLNRFFSNLGTFLSTDAARGYEQKGPEGLVEALKHSPITAALFAANGWLPGKPLQTVGAGGAFVTSAAIGGERDPEKLTESFLTGALLHFLMAPSDKPNYMTGVVKDWIERNKISAQEWLEMQRTMRGRGEEGEGGVVGETGTPPGPTPPIPGAGRGQSVTSIKSWFTGQEGLTIVQVPKEDIHTDPETFQYKLGYEEGTGAGLALTDARRFDPLLSGVLTLWRSPEGKLFVVNGHQRLALAHRTGYGEPLNARILDSSQYSQAQARAIGARINIAEGRGTEIDAAKFMRDSGTTAEDLARDGVSLSEFKTKRAVALSKLTDGIFHETVLGRFNLEKSVIIGERLGNYPEAQESIFKTIRDFENRGKVISNGKLAELINIGLSAGVDASRQKTLFGEEEIRSSLMMEKADLIDYSKRLLREGKNLFGMVARRKARIEEAGNVIDPETNQTISQESAEGLALLDRFANMAGTDTNALLNEYAARLSGTKQKAQVRKELYENLKDAIAADKARFGLGEGARPGLSEKVPGAGADVAESGGGGGIELKGGRVQTAPLDNSALALVKRTFPGIDDHTAEILANDPDLFNKIATGSLSAVDRQRIAEIEAQAAQPIPRSLPGLGMGLFDQTAQVTISPEAKGETKPAETPLPEPLPTPEAGRSDSEAKPISDPSERPEPPSVVTSGARTEKPPPAPPQGESLPFRQGNSIFVVREDGILYRRGAGDKPDVAVAEHRDGYWYDIRSGQRFTRNTDAWDMALWEVKPELADEYMKRYLNLGMGLGLFAPGATSTPELLGVVLLGMGLGQLFVPGRPLHRAWQALRARWKPEGFYGDPNETSSHWVRTEDGQELRQFVTGDGKVIERDAAGNERRVATFDHERLLWLNERTGRYIRNLKIVSEYDQRLLEVAPQMAERRFRAVFTDGKYDWLGNRALEKFRANVDMIKQRRAIQEAVGEDHWGPLSRQADEAIHLYNDMIWGKEGAVGEVWQHLPNSKKQLYLEAKQLVEGNQGLFFVAEEMGDISRTIGERAKEAGIIGNVIENHVNRVWDLEASPDVMARRRFATSTPHARERTLETIAHGWAEGLELKIKGATESQMILREELGNVMADRGFVKWGKGLRLFSTDRKPGWKLLDHPSLSAWKRTGEIVTKPDSATIEEFKRRGLYIDAEGQVFEKRPLYAPPGIAEPINRILGLDKTEGPVWGWLLKWNGKIKNAVLTYSLFHPQAYLRSYLLGVPGKTWGELNVGQAIQRGHDAIMANDPVVEMLVKQGMTLFRANDIEVAAREAPTVFSRMLEKIPVGETDLRRALIGLHTQFTNWVFNRVGTGLKTSAALIEVRNMQQRNPHMPLEDVCRAVADLVNSNFGGLNLQLMERSAANQRIFRLLALAPDWTESNFRAFVQAFRHSDIRGLNDAYRRLWGSVIARGAAAMLAGNVIMSAFDDRGFGERFKDAWKAGNLRWLDIDVTPAYRGAYTATGQEASESRKYISLFGHFKDILRMVANPVKFFHHKGSVFYRYAHELATGANWKGNTFTTLGELMGMTSDPEFDPLRGAFTKESPSRGPVSLSQAPSYLGAQARQSLPIPAQNLLGFIQGELDAFDAITRSVGIMEASTKPTTDAEDVMRDILAARTPPGTPAGRKQARMKADLKDLGRKDAEKFLPELAKKRDAGELTDKEILNVLKEAAIPKSLARFQRLKVEDIPRVWDVANHTEKGMFAPESLSKWAKIKDEVRKEATLQQLVPIWADALERGHLSQETISQILSK